MRKLLTIVTLTLTVLAGSTSAMAATANTPYDDLPDWAEEALMSEK
jgi:hypothetical protein